MNEIGVAGHGDDREIGITEGIADLVGLLLRQGLIGSIEVLKGHVQLYAVKVGGLDTADDLVHLIGIITGENTNADHNCSSLLYLIPIRLHQSVGSSISLRATVRFSAIDL